ncbi:phage terminase small subunit [Anaerococcus vaginalis]|uniref:phage terminase small subunit n=1 Tax=Anaerococcus vaginalis TaxID=33037 RepID=UPI0029114BA5|nr:phage terminase small subunit [Anaerococcus vaginalis]MDU6546244.1 phage terminase small subunit [Anaerococcus vaginalis]MDU7141348.1 phage terminase small subunit [Anaerococcus vaginalis]
MARERRPERDLAFELFRKSKGRLEVKEIAKKLNVKAATVSQWKYRDKWEEKLKEKRRGGQFGNKNAEGAGAPKGNKNAETHGGYSSIDLNNLPEEDQAYISNLSLDTETNFKNELKILLAKEKDIRRRLEALDYEPEDKLYLSRESEMQAVPKPEQLEGLEPEERVERISKLQPTLKTITRDSKFERQQKLLVAFDRIHGRIIKLLDSIKTYQLDCKRIELDQQRYELSKEKVKGAFEFDLEDELEDL